MTSASRTSMAAEIAEQPAAVAATLDRLRPLRADIARLADDARAFLFFARGSSDNAALYGRYLLEVHAHRLSSLGAPSVATLYDSPLDLADVVVVALSQSGETHEIVEAMQWASRRGARTLAVTNSADSRLAAQADLALVTEAGEERAVPATKSYTTQLAALATVAAALRPTPELDTALEAVPEAQRVILQRQDDVQAMAEALVATDRLFVTGRGLVYGTALEIALKLQEATYTAALGISDADLQHGPIAAVGEGTPVLFVAADAGPVMAGALQLAQAVAARGQRVLGIGGGGALGELCTAWTPGPDLPELVAPLALVVPGQLLTERLAVLKGFDPDRPRSLSKVTQTLE